VSQAILSAGRANIEPKLSEVSRPDIMCTSLSGSNAMTTRLLPSLAKKEIKKWRREWKLNLIEQINPEWVDLFETLAT
jgi:hypothetical protein